MNLKGHLERILEVLSDFNLVLTLYHLPLSDPLETRGKPYGSLLLGLVTIVVSIITFNNAISVILLSSKNITPGLFLGLNTLTSTFVHSNLSHLLTNMSCYFLLAPLIERRIGTTNFILLYFMGNIFGSFVTYQSLGGNTFSSDLRFGIGASASISALISYIALINLKRKIRILNIFNIPGITLAILTALMIIGDYHGMVYAKGARIGYAAHMGGYLGGFLYYLFFNTRSDNLIHFSHLKKHIWNYLMLAIFPPLFFILKKSYGIAGIVFILLFKNYHFATIVSLIIYLTIDWDKKEQDEFLKKHDYNDKMAA